jgi:hypothetical protein
VYQEIKAMTKLFPPKPAIAVLLVFSLLLGGLFAIPATVAFAKVMPHGTRPQTGQSIQSEPVSDGDIAAQIEATNPEWVNPLQSLESRISRLKLLLY